MAINGYPAEIKTQTTESSMYSQTPCAWLSYIFLNLIRENSLVAIYSDHVIIM